MNQTELKIETGGGVITIRIEFHVSFDNGQVPDVVAHVGKKRGRKPKPFVFTCTEMLNDAKWGDTIRHIYNLDDWQFSQLVDEFVSYCHAVGKNHETRKSAYGHFTNWMNKRKINGQIPPKQIGMVDDDASRAFDYISKLSL